MAGETFQIGERVNWQSGGPTAEGRRAAHRAEAMSRAQPVRA